MSGAPLTTGDLTMTRSRLLALLACCAFGAVIARSFYLIHTRTIAVIACADHRESVVRARGASWAQTQREEAVLSCQIAVAGGAR
jgi:hypothetical protein